VNINAKIGDSCKSAVKALGDTAGNLIRSAADSLHEAGKSVGQVPECFSEIGQKITACSNTQAQEQAACNAAYIATRDGPCNIVCDAFTNCDDIQCTSFNDCGDLFFVLQPACWAARGLCEGFAAAERVGCNIARGLCVAAAAVARGLCIAVAKGIQLACNAAAIAKGLACKVAAGVGVAACILGSLLMAGIYVLIAAAKGLAAVGVGLVALQVQLTCVIGGWAINRLCRLGTWFVGAGCKLGAGALRGVCEVGAAIVRLTNWVGGLARA
jgi:hypothetical protein